MSEQTAVADRSVALTNVRVRDTRVVHGDVAGAPPLYTPAGKSPMAALWIEVTWPFGWEHPIVEVGCGSLGGRHRMRPVVRRFHTPEMYAGAPEWIREFAERHRPAVADV
jgi:hypothetical protein